MITIKIDPATLEKLREMSSRENIDKLMIDNLDLLIKSKAEMLDMLWRGNEPDHDMRPSMTIDVTATPVGDAKLIDGATEEDT